MKIKLPKAYRDDYWWTAQGHVIIDVDSIESVEQCYDQTPSGSQSVAYVLITMKSGVKHKVFEFLSKVEEIIGK
jgi:hypothetical protein